MKNVMKRCLALIILFEKHTVGIDANYIKDNIPQYRELSPSAFHRSFERDKEVLRSMGFVINYSNDKWELESGYEISGTDIWKSIENNLKDKSIDFITIFLYIKKIINFEDGTQLSLDDEKFSLLQKAITNKLRVSFLYKNSKRVVYPYAFKLYKDSWYLCAVDNEISKTYVIRHVDEIKLANKAHSKNLSPYLQNTKFSWEKDSNKISMNLVMNKRTYFLYQNTFIHKQINSTVNGDDLLLDIETYDDYGLKIFLILAADSLTSISIDDKNFVRELVNEFQ